MVGYAYSADSSSNYEYILIKAYNCEDFSFVNTSTDYCLYKLRRKDYAVIPGNTGAKQNANLSYKNICLIADMLINEEYKNMYPVVVGWQITLSGICNVKSCSDMESVWPLSPAHMNVEYPCANISTLCFKRPFSLLEASYVASVINETAYLCGVYMGDLFVVSANQIFCSLGFVQLADSVFGYNKLSAEFLRFGKIKKHVQIPSVKQICGNISGVSFDAAAVGYGYNTILAGIKSECIQRLLKYIEKSLCHPVGYTRFIRGVRCIIGKSLREINSFSSEFMQRSNLSRSTDMNYLYFDELLASFTFADSMRDVQKTVRKNRERVANVKKLSKPEFIYERKIIYKRCGNEN